MKIISTFFSMLLLVSCASSKQTIYTASTPAAPVVRAFLGISQSDSVDFIRWKLALSSNQFSLDCNYGIGKNNTNGFINGGKKVSFQGKFKKEKNILELQHDGKILTLAEINSDLLQLLDDDGSMLTGNGGWSYTLNNTSPLFPGEVKITVTQSTFKDSAVYDGRTPCKVPGIVAPGTQCYKLKWRITFHADAGKDGAGTYKVIGTPWYDEGGRTGNWKVVTGKDGRIIYKLTDNSGKEFVTLLKLDEHLLLFIDTEGKLLVGDEDFSYTTNRIK